MRASSIRLAATTLIGPFFIFVGGCSDGPIVLRSQADRHIQEPVDADDPTAAKCQQVRDQIHSNQESLREAPTTSISPEIVAAAQGHADQRIDDLRSELDSLGCNDQLPADATDASASRLPPMQAAPNAPNR